MPVSGRKIVGGEGGDLNYFGAALRLAKPNGLSSLQPYMYIPTLKLLSSLPMCSYLMIGVLEIAAELSQCLG